MNLPVTGQVKIAIIGAGLIGRAHSLMLRLIGDRTEAGVRVVAVCDIDHSAAERLAAKWPGAKVAHTPTEVFEDRAIDAVFICTPTSQHMHACLEAARAGKHVFCEKPLAMDAAQAAAMADAVEAAGVVGQVGLVLRFSPIYTVIRSLAADPEIGAILAVTMRDDQDFPIRGSHPSPWRNDPLQTPAGTLIEHSVHDFDLLRWMLAPIRRVDCRTRVVNGAPGIEDCALTTIEFAPGFQGQHASIWHKVMKRPSNRRFELFAENLFLAAEGDAEGAITIQRGDGEEERIEAAEVLRRFEQIILAERPFLSPLRDIIRIPYALEDAAFIAALRGQGRPDPGFRVGVEAQQIVEAAYQSARTGASADVTF